MSFFIPFYSLFLFFFFLPNSVRHYSKYFLNLGGYWKVTNLSWIWCQFYLHHSSTQTLSLCCENGSASETFYGLWKHLVYELYVKYPGIIRCLEGMRDEVIGLASLDCSSSLSPPHPSLIFFQQTGSHNYSYLCPYLQRVAFNHLLFVLGLYVLWLKEYTGGR